MDKATAILEKLDAAEIRSRLSELDAERKALMVLLRSAVQRERSRKKRDAGGAQ